MESPQPPDHLPALYRTVLDRVAELEHAGQRRLATEIRAAAVEAYAVWDEAAARRLIQIRRRIEHALDSSNRPAVAEPVTLAEPARG